MPNQATTWTATGEQSFPLFWEILNVAGPILFFAVLLFLVGRALVQNRRYRALSVFTQEDRTRLRQAIADAERKTVGEILPVVVERSDPHPGADWFAALAFVLAGSSLLMTWLPWAHPTWLLGVQLVMGLVGFGLARRLPGLKRLFIAEGRATAVAEEQAFQEFYANGLHRTEAATGVLLFVTLLEHRVVVMADEGINERVEDGFWIATDDAIRDGIRRGSLRDGLIEGVRRAGDRLAEHFPWTTGDRDEIPDRIIVRRE